MKNNLKLIQWGWTFVSPFWKMIVIVAFLPIISGFIQIIQPRISSQLIDSLAHLSLYGFYRSFVFTIIFTIVFFGFSLVSQLLSFRIDKKIGIYSETKLYESLIKKTKPQDSGNILTLFLQDMETVVSMYKNIIPSIITSLIMILFISSYLYNINKFIFLIVIGSAVIPSFISHYFGSRLAEITKVQKKIQDEYNTYIIESNKGLYSIQDECTELYFADRFLALLHKLFLSLWNYLRLQIGSSSGITCCSLLTNICLVLLSGKMIFDKVMSIGGLVSTMMYAGILNSRIQALVNNYQSIQVTMISFTRIQNFVNTKTETSIEIIEGTDNPSIELKQFSFSYDGKHKIFKNLDFLFPFPGIYGLKGKNGTGKSTLLSCIGGQQSAELTEGHLIFKGLTLNDIFILSSQNSTLFSDSVHQNLSLGHHFTTAELNNAIKKVGLTEIIASLPNGLATIIDAEKPPFSSGQIQRLLICRAMLQGNKIILLDEIDTSMDEESIFSFYSWLEEMKDKSIIVIATHHEKYDSLMQNQLSFNS